MPGSGLLRLSSRYVAYLPVSISSRLTLKYALKGEKGLIEPTYVYLSGVEGGEEVRKAVGGLDFFAVPTELGPSGALKVYNPLPNINDYEKKLLEAAVKGLKGNIEKGVDFIVNAESKL